MDIDCEHCDDTITGDGKEQAWSKLVGHMIAEHQLDPGASFEIEETETGTAIKFNEP